MVLPVFYQMHAGKGSISPHDAEHTQQVWYAKDVQSQRVSIKVSLLMEMASNFLQEESGQNVTGWRELKWYGVLFNWERNNREKNKKRMFVKTCWWLLPSIVTFSSWTHFSRQCLSCLEQEWVYFLYIFRLKLFHCQGFFFSVVEDFFVFAYKFGNGIVIPSLSKPPSTF